MSALRPVLLGAGAALAGRAALRAALLAKLRADVARLGDGDPGPFLAGFADDAVLRFAEGEHRWAGEHRGRAAIERFLRDFVAAGLRGEIRELWIGGPPWALTAVARFDDRAVGPAGEELYANRTAIVVRTRWGKVVEQDDFYADTERIAAFDRRLTELGVLPARRDG
ncbi:nuclear transport factor 2 family protein [Patulibacter brassicae]|uniref:Nuclear transport factor 2 family protein n=1 Tax=Patulibacter brassicae TaxID=1705717 RepID=A0ABU4VMW8_9ACTN|nr:nuclear transport factor 2 family protein [Patulibacter brassicae]MDX8153191.1 nuclear transport factor 2 family protein [Patulibacter brassicae]